MENELIDKARAIITDRRLKALNENEQRIREINQKIPQIREINDTLFNTGREIIKLISESRGQDVSQKIERIRQNNLGAQAMCRQLLVNGGYPADYLDVHFTCPECKDTGYRGHMYCDCLKKLLGKLAADELNKNAQLELSSFSSFKLSYYSGNDYFTMEKIYNYARKYAQEFSEDSESVLMFGKTGLGKTHLSLAIADEVLKKGYTVIYDSVINILRNIEKEHFSYEHSSDMIDMVMDADLLILDDLGTEYETKFYNSTIYNIINTRLNSRKPTIISTNMDFRKLKERYDERVASRLITMYTGLEFAGEDIRLLKAINKKAEQA